MKRKKMTEDWVGLELLCREKQEGKKMQKKERGKQERMSACVGPVSQWVVFSSLLLWQQHVTERSHGERRACWLLFSFSLKSSHTDSSLPLPSFFFHTFSVCIKDGEQIFSWRCLFLPEPHARVKLEQCVGEHGNTLITHQLNIPANQKSAYSIFSRLKTQLK